MNITLAKALLAIVSIFALSLASGIRFRKERTLGSFLQLLGAACLVIVVLTHFCEALRLFPWMHWGNEHSAGHYLDLASAVLGLTLFPLGWLSHALSEHK
jgi:succinate dehydrogenase/fumarate reductase cytochrome b subunit